MGNVLRHVEAINFVWAQLVMILHPALAILAQEQQVQERVQQETVIHLLQLAVQDNLLVVAIVVTNQHNIVKMWEFIISFQCAQHWEHVLKLDQ